MPAPPDGPVLAAHGSTLLEARRTDHHVLFANGPARDTTGILERTRRGIIDDTHQLRRERVEDTASSGLRIE